MSTTKLAGNLGGAIGCDYRRLRNQLVFVEFEGKVSRLDLANSSASVQSSGTTTIVSGHSFDFDTGAEAPNRDVFWHPPINRPNKPLIMEPTNGAKIASLGRVNFDSVTVDTLRGLNYSTTPLSAKGDFDSALGTGNVFAVLTTDNNYAKVKVVRLANDIDIQWVTYHPGPAYQVLGTGYQSPEDIVVRSDERTAYVTERTGNLLMVDLTSAGRPSARLIARGLNAPQQIALDEARSQAYVVEFANPGRLLRIDVPRTVLTLDLDTPPIGRRPPRPLPLATPVTVADNLEFPVGLLMTSDSRYAYVSEQATGGGRVSRIDLNTGNREIIATGLMQPFFLAWADDNQSGILVPERDPANNLALINLTQSPASIIRIATGLPARPSSVAVKTPGHLLVCSDQEIVELDLVTSVFPTGLILFGIGHVPVDHIGADGYADTTDLTGYFFQVKDAPFGGTLPVMFSFEKAFNDGARYYKLEVDGKEPLQTWTDLKFDPGSNRFVAQTVSPSSTGFYPVRPAGERQLWYHDTLGYMLNTAGLTNSPHTIRVRLYADQNPATEIGTASDSGRSVVVLIDNQWPLASIDAILHDGAEVGACAIVNSGSRGFKFRITARDPDQHLASWSLSALWGANRSKSVDSDDYSNHVSSSKLWAGQSSSEPVPIHPAPSDWNAFVSGDPTSINCAHTFFLSVQDRVIDGWNRGLHYSEYHKSITIMLGP